MKKTTMIFIVLFFVISNVYGEESLTWCAYYNWSPWIYPVEKGYDGILIEQLKDFEKDHDLNTKVTVINNWKRCQKQLEHNRIDMILGANKTEEREKIFFYMNEPAFINKTTVSAYALKENKSVTPVDNIDGLKKYKLQTVRGNSFGNKVDAFIKTIPENRKKIVNEHDNLFNMILLKRGDYFFYPDNSFEPLIKQYKEKIPKLESDHFHKIFSTEREVPAYIVFSKQGNNFEKYALLWEETIKKYYSKVDIDERIKYHNERSKKVSK